MSLTNKIIESLGDIKLLSNNFKIQKKEDDYHVLNTITKTKVIQEVNDFMKNPHTKQWIWTMSKVLYVLGRGTVFTKKESTNVYLSSTQLFQSRDPKLIRMLLILIKDLAKSAGDTFLAINSLYKEIHSHAGDYAGDIAKANAIRALRTIADAGTLNQRWLTEAIVDKNPAVASAALVSTYHLLNDSQDNKIFEIIKRWINQVNSSLMSSDAMVQYHALALLHKLKKEDPLAVTKWISNEATSFNSPLAHTLLLRFGARVLKKEWKKVEHKLNPKTQEKLLAKFKKIDIVKTIVNYANSCLNYKNNIIVLEAAKQLCNFGFMTEQELIPAVNILKTFLDKSTIHQFAAVRILHQLADSAPTAVGACSKELEELIQIQNKTISTLAIITLLKTGQEDTIQRLLSKIETLLHEMDDEYKIVIIRAVKTLCLRFPSKNSQMVVFLSGALKEEGGYDYKREIVTAFVSILSTIEEAREMGVMYLCEFIEDCEYVLILTQILHFLGTVGPKLKEPQACIRSIYNRVNLETAPVREAALLALTKFGAAVPKLKPSIIAILKRTILMDSEDEVREKAILFLKLLEIENEELVNSLIMETQDEVASAEKNGEDFDEIGEEEDQENEEKDNEKTEEQEESKEKTEPKKVQQTSNEDENDEDNEEDAKSGKKDISPLESMPEFAALGKAFSQSSIMPLTEPDSDYVVNCVKFVFQKTIICQFLITNNVKQQKLFNVTIVAGEMEGFKQVFGKWNTIDVLPHSQTKQLFVRYEIKDQNQTQTIMDILSKRIYAVPITLNFQSKEIDEDEEQEKAKQEEEEENEEDLEDDEVICEELQFSFIDCCKKKQGGDFRKMWEDMELNAKQQLADNYTPEQATELIESSSQKNYRNKSIDDCARILIKTIGVKPTNKKKTSSKKKNQKIISIYFSLEFLRGEETLIIARLEEKAEEKDEVILKCAVRSNLDISRDYLLKLIDHALSE